MPQTCKKPLHKNIRVVLCKKTAQKGTKYSKNETILKIGHLANAIAHAKAKAIAHAKVVAFAKLSVWGQSKNARNLRKTTLTPF